MPKNSSSNIPHKVQWWKSANRAAPSTKIQDISLYGSILKIPATSPIDEFLQKSEALILQGDQQLLNSNPEIANLLFVGIVAHTENYFRDLFAELLQLCPVSQVKSSARDVKLGSVIWHRAGNIERGAFEAFSFASADNIIETLKKYFDVTIDSKSDSYALLQEFDQLCELRHAIVHSGSIMSGKNVIKLKLPRTNQNLHVQLNFQTFQEASSIATSLICSINTELFKVFGLRWRDEWPKKLHNWSPRLKNSKFDDLWNLFFSKTDSNRTSTSVRLSKLQCKTEVLKP